MAKSRDEGDRRTGGPPRADALRGAIDRGEARDKVAGSDPAAAPLGTDAEAGGAPPSEAEVATAVREEIGRGGPQLPRDPGREGGLGTRRTGLWIAVAAIVALGAALLLAGT